MAIITKPVGGIFKGVPATITLNKSELSALASVSADSYFSVTTNWNKVILSYKSFDGNQQEIVEFDATLASPTGFFDVSTTARNLFEIQVIKIIDFDGGIFIVPRSELVIADFDVIFVSPPSSLSYTTPVIYTQNETITNNVPSVIGTVNSYSISPALPTGLTINPTTGVISGTPTVAVAAANYTVTASNSGGPTTAIVNITVEEAVVVGDYIDYNVNTFSYTLNSTGGVSNGSSSDDAFVKSTTDAISGDFEYEWKFNWSAYPNNANILVGVTSVAANDPYWYRQLCCIEGMGNNQYRLWFNENAGVVSGVTFTSGDHIFKIRRLGNVFNYYLDGTVIYTNTGFTGTAYPTVRTKGAIACTESSYDATPSTTPVFFDGVSNGKYVSLATANSAIRLLPSENEAARSKFWCTQPITGDFTYTATIKAGTIGESVCQALFGLNDGVPPTGNPGDVYALESQGWGISFDTGGFVKPWDVSSTQISWNRGSTYQFEMKRISGVVSFKIDSTTFSYTLNTSSTVYIVGCLQVGSWEVTNASLVLPEVPVGDPIIWDLFLNGATTEADGGLIGASTAAYSFTKSNASKIDNGADFKITYKFTDLVADWVHGISSVLTEESQSQFNFTGLTYQQSFLISYYRGVQQPNQSLSILNSPGENTLVIERTGTNLTFTLNNTVVLSKTDYTEQLTVPAVRPWNVRALDSATVELLEAPTETYVIWNNTSSGYLVEADGGATWTPQRPLNGEYDFVFADPSQWVTGDFTIEWETSAWAGDVNLVGFYNQTSQATTTAFLGGRIYFLQNLVATYSVPFGTNRYKINRTGYVVKFFLNDVELYSGTQTQANYDLIKRPVFSFSNYSASTAIVKTTIDIPEVPVGDSFSPSLIPSNISLSNNNRTAENTQVINYTSAPVVPSIMLNSSRKVYSEFTVENVAASTIIAFGAFFRTGDPTVSDLVSPSSVTIPGGHIPAQNRIVYQGGAVYVGTSLVVTFGVIASNMVVGLGIDLVANTAFVTKDGVKVGSDFSITAALPGSDRVFFAVGPNQVGEKFTINETPAYTLPSGYEYIG